MCGIVGAVARRDVEDILLEGLKCLEYRGYDSAGVCLVTSDQTVHRARVEGKVELLVQRLKQRPLAGKTGIAHTRWATHGVPSEANAHPHMSGEFAIVHNGIIENYFEFRPVLEKAGYQFSSQTDTEVIVHLVAETYKKTQNLLEAVQEVVQKLSGAFAFAILHARDPHHLVAVQKGCPLVIGVGIGERFFASDQLALLPVTRQFIYLEEGDVVSLSASEHKIYDASGQLVERPAQISDLLQSSADRGHYRHFMLKEIFEQPDAVVNTLEGRLFQNKISDEIFGVGAKAILDRVERVQIVACGTSYHAGLVARFWLESLAKIPCQVEIASEIRYRNPVVQPNTLFVTLSQSGETADTIAALHHAKESGYLASLAICNVAQSPLVRASDLVLLTRAGPEIGVASTKAFITQLVALQLLVCALGSRQALKEKQLTELMAQLPLIPRLMEAVLQQADQIEQIALQLVQKNHALFLGRGIQYPIAMEGALKLKEISYIHAEAYPAGELKHGPLALIDENMPVIVTAPQDDLVDKLKSNLQEVQARGGNLILFAAPEVELSLTKEFVRFTMPSVPAFLTPLLYTIPLQLLAYYVAFHKGTDIDKPRNLAKSVTVE